MKGIEFVPGYAVIGNEVCERVGATNAESIHRNVLVDELTGTVGS